MKSSSRNADDLVLKATYDRARGENDRIRNARGWAARQLGPLPSAAGISVGIVAAFSGHLNKWLVGGALFGLGAMVVIGFLYSGTQAYRQMYALRRRKWEEELRRDHPDLAEAAAIKRIQPEDLLAPGDWYATMIRRERELYDSGRKDHTRNHYGPPTREAEDLQDAFDRERTGVFAVQLLFVAVIVCLVLARLV